jgi:hypothetical protein
LRLLAAELRVLRLSHVILLVPLVPRSSVASPLLGLRASRQEDLDWLLGRLRGLLGGLWGRLGWLSHLRDAHELLVGEVGLSQLSSHRREDIGLGNGRESGCGSRRGCVLSCKVGDKGSRRCTLSLFN